MREWSETTGIPRSTLINRLSRGWTVEKALTTPSYKPSEIPRERRFDIKEEDLRNYMSNGLSLNEIGDIYGCTRQTVMKRAKEYGIAIPKKGPGNKTGKKGSWKSPAGKKRKLKADDISDEGIMRLTAAVFENLRKIFRNSIKKGCESRETRLFLNSYTGTLMLALFGINMSGDEVYETWKASLKKEIYG